MDVKQTDSLGILERTALSYVDIVHAILERYGMTETNMVIGGAALMRTAFIWFVMWWNRSLALRMRSLLSRRQRSDVSRDGQDVIVG